MEFRINNRLIAPHKKPYIVAEISCNHGGSLSTLIKTIEAAKASGADAVKLQTYTADDLTLNSDLPHFRINKDKWGASTLYELYEKTAMPMDFHKPAFAHANRIGIDIFSTPFSPKAIDFLEQFNPCAYKIASMEIGYKDLIERASATKKPVIVSTGGAHMNEIESLRHVGMASPLCLLHCVSEYPADSSRMNLNRINSLKRFPFADIVGLSDHSMNTLSSSYAVPMGACIFEHHFQLHGQSTPDSPFSYNPAQFLLYVQRILDAHRMMYSAEPMERNQYARRIYATKDIKLGQRLTSKNIGYLRPASQFMTAKSDLPYSYYHAITHSKKSMYRAACNIKLGTPIDTYHLETDYDRVTS